jgi:hypothetical protein
MRGEQCAMNGACSDAMTGPPPAPEWRANPGPQSRFLASNSYEGLYGGAAGGGKSEALLMGALRHIDKPEYRALLLRRTFPELQRSLIDRSRFWYAMAGGRYNDAKHFWDFPSGARIEFGHLEYAHSVHAYQSAEYQFIGFDELTSFLKSQYVYMLSRARSSSGIPVRIRAATNPGGVGHDWVMRRWAPWLDAAAARRAEAGELLYYRNTEEGERWALRGEESALSRVFVPARIADNPHLALKDPGYAERLKGLDRITRAQLLEGDWVSRIEGALWNHDLIEASRISTEEYQRCEVIRCVVAVDPSGSAKRSADIAGIVCAAMGYCSCKGRREIHAFILDDESGRYSPQDMGRRAIALYHRRHADRLVAEDNFGGKMIEDLVQLIDPGVAYLAVHASRGKIIRAEPVAALYEQGKVHHAGCLPELEAELCSYAPLSSTESPGRLDAAVWAVHDLMLRQRFILSDDAPLSGGTRRE